MNTGKYKKTICVIENQCKLLSLYAYMSSLNSLKEGDISPFIKQKKRKFYAKKISNIYFGQ